VEPLCGTKQAQLRDLRGFIDTIKGCCILASSSPSVETVPLKVGVSQTGLANLMRSKLRLAKSVCGTPEPVNLYVDGAHA
jgi:hypothetical protein